MLATMAEPVSSERNETQVLSSLLGALRKAPEGAVDSDFLGRLEQAIRNEDGAEIQALLEELDQHAKQLAAA